MEQRVILRLIGMSCAACAARIEKTLRRQTGVRRAVVNFAAEKASVDYDPARVGVDDLIAAVAAAGYEARPAESAALARRSGKGRSIVNAGVSSWPPAFPFLSCSGWFFICSKWKP